MTRVCFVSRVRPDRLEEYRQRHAAVWPAMLVALRDTGWRDYSLFLSREGLLVGYLHTDDYAAAQDAMAATAINPVWQAEMAGFFVDDGNPDEGFVVLDEVFHLEDQLTAAGLAAEPSSTTPAVGSPTALSTSNATSPVTGTTTQGASA